MYLEIFDDTPVNAPTDVDLDVFDGPGGAKLGSLHRTAGAQTSASAALGSVVILAGADAGATKLHIQGQRSSGTATLSNGSVDVALVVRRQVSARLQLAHRGGDAGATDTGPGADAGTPDAGIPDAGAPRDTAPPADATPPVDTGVDRGTLLRNGDSCTSAAMCSSGFCADGVCCNNDCTTLCHACNLAASRGTCSPLPAGNECVAAACDVNDRLVPARTCDNAGNCGAATTPQSCGNYHCQNGDCLRSCNGSNDCAGNARCFANRCL